MNSNQKGLFFASTTALLWGFLAIALKISLLNLDPVTIVWFRFTFSFLCLFLIFSFKNQNHLSILRKPPLLLIVSGFCLGLNYLGYLQGVKYTSPSNTQILIQIAPVGFALVGIIFFKEKVSLKQILGFILVFGGFSLFYKDQLVNFISQKDDYNLGVLWIFFAATAWILYASIQKKFTNIYSPQQINLLIYLIPTIMFLPFIQFKAFFNLSFGTWLLLLFLGLNTLIAYGALSEAFRYLEANKISVIILLNPIITIISMYLLDFFEFNLINSESISLGGILGAFLVIIGAILIVTKKKS